MQSFGSFSYAFPYFCYVPSIYMTQPCYFHPQITSINEAEVIEVRTQQSIQIKAPVSNNASLIKKITQKVQELHKSPMGSKKTHWTQNQDELLQKLILKEKLDWKEIPRWFEGRTLSMCYSRYRRILMNTKDGWKRQDDELIQTMVNSIGEKWKQISMQIPKFTPKQIRERYLNYLRPNINKEEFTLEQDIKICQLVLNQGKHWRKFEQQLPGRTQGGIKSRFYSKLKNILQIL